MTSQLDSDRSQLEKLDKEALILIILTLQRQVQELQQIVAEQAAEIQGLRDQLAKHPTRVIEHAVRGMLPKNRLGRRMFKHLKVYAGPEHPHEAQQPQPLEL